MTLAETQQAHGICMAVNVPTLMMGSPGVGKSSMHRQIADKYGFHFEVLLLTQRTPNDVNGIQFVNSTNDSLVMIPPAFLRRIEKAAAKGQRTLLLIDELTTASPTLQAVALPIVLDRRVGDTDLPEGTIVAAAANPPESASGGGYDIDPPLANRFAHLTYSPSAADIAAGFLNGWSSSDIPDLDPAALAEQEKRVRVLVGGFLNAQGGFANKNPIDVKKDRVAAGRAWPSPRTWDFVIKLLAGAWVANATPEVIRILVNSAVGSEAAGAFLTYVRSEDLPASEDLLSGAAQLRFPMRPDQAQMICAGLMTAVADNTTAERYMRASDLLGEIASNGKKEIATAYGYILAGEHPHDRNKPLRERNQFRPAGAVITGFLLDVMGPLMLEAQLVSGR